LPVSAVPAASYTTLGDPIMIDISTQFKGLRSFGVVRVSSELYPELSPEDHSRETRSVPAALTDKPKHGAST
jgi:hypothetical protein